MCESIFPNIIHSMLRLISMALLQNFILWISLYTVAPVCTTVLENEDAILGTAV